MGRLVWATVVENGIMMGGTPSNNSATMKETIIYQMLMSLTLC